MADLEFYLGADTHWLGRLDVPLMVSHRRLRRRRTLPRALAPWVCDSGGFSELTHFGRWTISTREYAVAVRRYRDEVGQLVWAAPQDLMCEPHLVAKTGLTVREHQRRTTANGLELRSLAPDLPWIYVLQGWVLTDYLRHLDDHHRAGVDLTTEPVVGLGTVCRRQATREIAAIVWTLATHGLRLHGFGVKVAGLASYGHTLVSADSQAGSFGARLRVGRCPHGIVRWEANCPEWARRWRDDVLASLTGPAQPALSVEVRRG